MLQYADKKERVKSMDFLTILTEHFVLVVMIACLVVGYIIKHASFLKIIKNDDIPSILAVFGAVLNSIVSGLSVASIVYGAFMGLASTGLHQAFKKFIESARSEEGKK
jgi:flagellar motor component MotA